MDSSPLVIKISTAVLKDEKNNLNQKRVADIVSQIAEQSKKGYSIILVTSGAVGVGRTIKNIEFKKNKVLEKQILASLGQPHLIHLYHQLFDKFKINVAQILLTRNNFKNREEYLNLRRVLENLLKQDIIPIINENDTVAIDEFCFSDNDQLAVLTAISVQAQKIIFLSSIPGLYNCDPLKNKKCKIISEVKKIDDEFINRVVGKSISREGRGGMITKLKSIDLAMRAGIPAQIVNGAIEKIITKVMEKNNLGTQFIARPEQFVSGRKKWLLAGALARGKIIVDEGAINSLQKKKSLLAVGIIGTEGKFKTQEVIYIVDANHRLIASGLTNYSSKDLSIIDKKNKSAVRQNFKREVVHCNNLILF